MTIKCYTFFGCKKQKCVIREEGEGEKCWEVEPSLTPCTNMFMENLEMKDKLVYCKNCLFYEHVNKAGDGLE